MNRYIPHHITFCRQAGRWLAATMILLFAYCMPSTAQEEHLPSYYITRIKNYVRVNAWLEAKHMIDEGLQYYPDEPDLRYYNGRYYYVTGEMEKARYQLVRATQVNDQHFHSKRLLVDVEDTLHHHSSAICYINELLEFQPYDRDLWRRKIGLYRKMGNQAEADAALHRLAQIYPTDTLVTNDIRHRNREQWDEVLSRSPLTEAASNMERWLEQDKDNLNYYVELMSLYDQMGEYDRAIGVANRGLARFPKTRVLVHKVVGILVSRGLYTQAMAFLKDNGNEKKLYNDLLQELANDARQHDPYEANARLYAVTGNHDALQYLINTALSRRYDDDARMYINEAIKHEGRTPALLMKLYSLEKRAGNKQASTRILEELYTMDPQDEELVEMYANLMLELGSQEMEEEQWLEARKYLARALELITPDQEVWPAAMSRQITVLGHLNKFSEARALYNKALKYTDEESRKRFASAYEDIVANRLRILIEGEQYQEALTEAQDLMDTEPESDAALRTCINMCQTLKRDKLYQQYAEIGYKRHPDSPYFIIKQALSLQQQGRTAEALDLVRPCRVTDEWVNPQLINAYSGISTDWANELLKSHMPDIALQVVDSALAYNPNNKELLYLKGVAHEHLKDFGKAYEYESRNYEPSNAEQQEFYEHMRYLRFRSYKNRVDASYTTAFYDTKENGLATVGHLYSIATVSYSRLLKRDVITGQISYKGIDGYHDGTENESGGVGLEFTGQWEHTFNHRWSGMANLAYSTQFFNKVGANISASYAANRGWTPSFRFGYRLTPKTYLYLDQGQTTQDKFNLFLLSPSVEKSWGTIKAFANLDLIAMQSGVYYNVGLKGKLFINDDNISSVSILTGFGSFPELSFFEQTALRNVSHTNAMVGFDAQYLLTRNFYLGLAGSWNTCYNPHRLSDGTLTDSYRNIFSLTIQLHVAF